MTDSNDVRATLQKFQDGYTSRDVTRLDDFMQLFVQSEAIEMIGIGASQRAAREWYEGFNQVRIFIENDWKYWGDVRLDVEGAKITIHGDVAWLSTTGFLIQTQAFEVAIDFYLQEMKSFFERGDLSADEKLVEATHFGMRRWRERAKGIEYSWSLVFTAVLLRDGGVWRFHTQHWAMPVD